ncbi:hypothetical protein [Dyella japonica]|uniref:Uncharacterized protein n=1 Tax=Dyella japonica TaxID=231455 RepID=A0ABV2K1W0_9GAMM
MASISGYRGGYHYEGSWELITPSQVWWKVRVTDKNGEWCGTPSFQFDIWGDTSDSVVEMSVCLAIGKVIDGGIEVVRLPDVD